MKGQKTNFYHRHRAAIMIVTSIFSVASMGVATYAWFMTFKVPSVIISNGDLQINSASFTFYRWEFTKDEAGFLSPGIIEDGEGSFHTGVLTYSGSGERSITGTEDALTMNMYDPYLSQVYAGQSFDLRTNSFVKLDVSVTTSCEFDFTLKSVLDSSYTLADSEYSALLSTYIQFRCLPTSSIDISSYTLGTDDSSIYDTLKAAFKTNYTGTISAFSTDNTALSLVSKSSVMGHDVTSSETTTISYWLCLDYDTTKLDDDFAATDFTKSDYSLYQDYYWQIEGDQTGI